MEFTDESILLIRNWQTVEDIQEAASGLEKEMAKFLKSVEQELDETDWWSEVWEFFDHAPRPDVGITTAKWRGADENVIWIGVDNFTCDRALGSADPPLLYVWVEEEDGHDLCQLLVARIDEMPGEPVGELDYKKNSSYAVKQPVQKCPPGGGEEYFEAVMEQTLDFCEHYASVLLELDDVIREHLAKGGE